MVRYKRKKGRLSMMKFEVKINQDTKQATVNEIAGLLQKGYVGAILVKYFYIQEHRIGDRLPINPLAIDSCSIPHESKGCIVLPTYFPPGFIPGYEGGLINATMPEEAVISFALFEIE